MTSENISWTKIGCKLSKNTLTALHKLNFTHPTPIQVHAIPTFLSKKDIVAQAVTGSGKTLSFIVPIMELLSKATDLKKSDVFAVILSPTTELANQTKQMFDEFLSNFEGDKPLVRQFSKKARLQEEEAEDETGGKGTVIVSTPGSLAKALEESPQGKAVAHLIRSLKRTEVLIMDEADRLLEMGFSAQLQTIIKSLPKQRMTGLYSATQTTEVEDLVRTGLRNPLRVSVKVTKGLVDGVNDTLPSGLSNYFLTVDCDRKVDVLVHFLGMHKDKKVLVFLATCASVDYFHRILSSILKKQTVLCIHRKLKAKRTALFQQFKDLDKGVMLCTDLMARGVDVPDIDWVVQMDAPKCASNYVHRCGRTARGSAEGRTLLMLLPSESVYLDFLAQNQAVRLDPLPDWPQDHEGVAPQHARMQAICAADRLLYEKGVRAFVAFVEHYKKHDLRYVFKLRDMDLGRLGNGFGLLRLPQMRELNGADTTGFIGSEVDLNGLTYKDKSLRLIKEKTRVIKREKRDAKDQQEDEETPKEAPVKSRRATGGQCKRPAKRAPKDKAAPAPKKTKFD